MSFSKNNFRHPLSLLTAPRDSAFEQFSVGEFCQNRSNQSVSSLTQEEWEMGLWAKLLICNKLPSSFVPFYDWRLAWDCLLQCEAAAKGETWTAEVPGQSSGKASCNFPKIPKMEHGTPFLEENETDQIILNFVLPLTFSQCILLWDTTGNQAPSQSKEWSSLKRSA